MAGLAAPPSPLLERLACPACGTGLLALEGAIECPACKARFAETEGVLDLRLPEARAKPEFADWTEHWSGAKQQSLPQRFFSLYRRAVFARTVAWFIERYFPAAGVFVEAGSGTAETSMRISKHGGQRTLVAVDLVLPVVTRCHPIMDVRLAADIFRLPFATGSIDGIWNVGVMEHFTHDLIDELLLEFRRVLRPARRCSCSGLRGIRCRRKSSGPSSRWSTGPEAPPPFASILRKSPSCARPSKRARCSVAPASSP